MTVELSAAGRRAWDRREAADPYADVPHIAEAVEIDPAAEHSWQPVDLGPYLRGDVVRPNPSIGARRSDGLRLLYPGKSHSIAAPTEAGKSWFAVASAVAELTAGHRVVYLHFEDDAQDTTERLLALGVPARDIGDPARFTFVEPSGPVRPDWLAQLLDPVPSLVVVDGFNQALSLHELEDKPKDIATFRRRVIKPCTTAGAATLECDHVQKNTEARATSRGQIGSVERINGLTGALIVLDNAEPFGRSLRGRSHVLVEKDRPGHLRAHGRAAAGPVGRTYLGELVVDDTQARSPDLELRFYAPRDDQDDDTSATAVPSTSTLADDVLAVLDGLLEQKVDTVAELRARMRQAGLRARAADVGDALQDLLVQNRIEELRGARGAKGYRSLTRSQDQDSRPVPGPVPPPVPAKDGNAERVEGEPVPERVGTGGNGSTNDDSGDAS